MTSLVIAEHDNASIKASTLNTVTAALAMGGDVHVLVAGHNAGAAARYRVSLDVCPRGGLEYGYAITELVRLAH